MHMQSEEEGCFVSAATGSLIHPVSIRLLTRLRLI
jgi:hypothetical protein